MGERNYALRLGETNRVGFRAIGVCVITPLAVVAVLANWAVPDGVGRVELFTEAAAVWKWEGSSRAAGRHFFVMILGHSEPPEAVVAGVFYCRGYGYSPSAHFFGSVVVRNEGAVVKVRVNTRNNSGLDEAASGFGVPDPPACPFIG